MTIYIYHYDYWNILFVIRSKWALLTCFIAEPFTMGLQCYRCPETHEDTEHGVLPACSSDYFGAAYLCKVRTVGNKTYPAQGCIKGMRGK